MWVRKGSYFGHLLSRHSLKPRQLFPTYFKLPMYESLGGGYNSFNPERRCPRHYFSFKLLHWM